MKVLGIVGSPRLGSNTEDVVAEALHVLEVEGIQTELVRLRDLDVGPCKGCLSCEKLGECSQDDDFNALFQRMVDSDGFIIGSPVYCSGPTADVMALIQRASFVARTTRPFDHKVGGPVVVARRSGKNFTLAQLLFFFMYVGMIVPGSNNWNGVLGGEPGAALQDRRGMETVRYFARNIAWTLKRTAGS